MHEISTQPRTADRESPEIRIARETRELADTGNYAEARDRLAALRALILPGLFPEARDPLRLIDGKDVVRTSRDSWPHGLAFTSDSQSIAWLGQDGRGGVMDLYGNPALEPRSWSMAQHLGEGEVVRSTSFLSPASLTLIATNQRVFLAPSGSGKEKEVVWDDDESSCGETYVSRKGDLIAFSRGEEAGKLKNAIHVYGKIEGRWKRLHTHEGARGTEFRSKLVGFAPEDRLLFFAAHEQLFAMPFEPENSRRSMPRPQRIFDFQDSGSLFCGATASCDKFLFRPALGGPMALIGYRDGAGRAVKLRNIERPDTITSAAISADGKEVAIGEVTGRIEVRRLGSFTSGARDATIAHTVVNGSVEKLSFSPCGKLLLGYTGSNELFVIGDNLRGRGVGR